MYEDDIFKWGGLIETSETPPTQPPIPQRKPPSRPRLNLNGRKTGNILYMTRATRGLTQQGLANKVGVSVKTINDIENHRSAPSVYLSMTIAKVLDTTVENIFTLYEPGSGRRLAPGSRRY
jgi:putative transcriptional regulator